MWNKAFWFVVFLFVQPVQADILFLDLNNAPQEVEAARRAASARGEKLVVLPQVSDEVRMRYEVLRAADLKLNKTCKSQPSMPGCAELKQKYPQLEAEVAKISKDFKIKGKEVLNSELRRLKDAGTTLSSVVISGHDGNGYFSGIFGDLNDRDLKEALEANPPLSEGIRSLMLWGCYTTNLGSLEFNWKQALPNVQVIAGYDGSSPAYDRPANWSYLEGFLVKEKELTDARDRQSVKRLFESIKMVNSVTAAACIGDFYISNGQVDSYKERLAECEKFKQDPESLKIYRCYERAEPKCPNPPENTQTSELRSFYNYVQRNLHCMMANPLETRDFPTPNDVIRLIYYDTIKANFMKHNAKELEQFNDLLKSIGVPDEFLLRGVQNLSRAEILKRLQGIEDVIDQKLGGKWRPEDILREDAAEILSVRDGLHTLNQSLNQYNCVPFSWVEPNAIEQSGCQPNEVLSAKTLQKNRQGLNAKRWQFTDHTIEAQLSQKYYELIRQELVQENKKRTDLLNQVSDINVDAARTAAMKAAAAEPLLQQAEAIERESTRKEYAAYEKINQEKAQALEREIAALKTKPQTPVLQEQIRYFQSQREKALDYLSPAQKREREIHLTKGLAQIYQNSRQSGQSPNSGSVGPSAADSLGSFLNGMGARSAGPGL